MMSKWTLITGNPSMAPYFSLGYHQSRWSYYSADDVSNVNFRFDHYNLPYDVIWLDIDVRIQIYNNHFQHTHEYEYFTWNPNRFSNKSIDMMMSKLRQSERKIVLISDPHIRKNDSYFLYQIFKSLENNETESENNSTSTNRQYYLVRNPYKTKTSSDDTFEG